MSPTNHKNNDNKVVNFPIATKQLLTGKPGSVTNVLLIRCQHKNEDELKIQLAQSGLNTNYSIETVSELFDALSLVEEFKYDLIVIDYSVAGNNTSNFLNYISTANPKNNRAAKIVLTEKSDHIDELERLRLLKHASKVTSKTATYFDMRTLLIRGSVKSCSL